MAAVAERDDVIGFESFKNTGDWINGSRSYRHRVGSVFASKGYDSSGTALCLIVIQSPKFSVSTPTRLSRV